MIEILIDNKIETRHPKGKHILFFNSGNNKHLTGIPIIGETFIYEDEMFVINKIEQPIIELIETKNEWALLCDKVNKE